MKKFFEIVGLLFLMTFSFYYTEKTASMVKEVDKIMLSIKEEKDNYKINPIDATISGNNIVPGINGREVNINKSYTNMRKNGIYSNKLYIYDIIKPNISINNKYNKYIISGNSKKNMVSLIFKVNAQDDLTNIIKILRCNNILGTFFVDGNWFEKNNDLIMNLINEGYIIGNMGYNLDYTNKNFVWINTILSRVGNQKINYCYAEVDNANTLTNCSLELMHTIKPNIIVKEYPLIEIKKSLTSGSIISMDVNSKVESELPLIIKYIESKNLKIVNLNEQISE